MKHEVSARINQALDLIPSVPKDYGRTSAAAKIFGESHQVVRQWLGANKHGEVSIPATEKLAHVASKLNISMEWLLTGRGAMHPGGDTLSINVNILGQAVQFAQENLASFGFDKLAYGKQAQILALIYDSVNDGSKLADTLKAHLKRSIKIMM